MKKGEAILIAWHIGDRRDVTLRAIETLRRLRHIAAEDVEQFRRELTRDFSIECGNKRFYSLPEPIDPALLDRLDRVLEEEDVGIAASGGAPCLLDPGSWLVRGLRERGHRVRALPGPAIFPTVMSLSGLDFHRSPAMASLAFFSADVHFADEFQSVAAREEAVFIFLGVRDLGECFRRLSLLFPHRVATVFVDVAKSPPARFPRGDEMHSASCAEWVEKAPSMDWSKVSDVAVLLHPQNRRVSPTTTAA